MTTWQTWKVLYANKTTKNKQTKKTPISSKNNYIVEDFRVLNLGGVLVWAPPTVGGKKITKASIKILQRKEGLVMGGWWNCIYIHTMPSCRTDKVDNFYSIFLTRPCIFDCYVIWCGSKIEYKKIKCLKEIGLCAQNMITILDTIFNIMKGEGLYNPFDAHKTLHFDNK